MEASKHCQTRAMSAISLQSFLLGRRGLPDCTVPSSGTQHLSSWLLSWRAYSDSSPCQILHNVLLRMRALSCSHRAKLLHIMHVVCLKI